MMSESLAVRLGDEQYMSAMSKVVDCTGLACSVTFFCALVEHCRLNGSDVDAVSTMISNGMLNSVVPQLWQRLSSVHHDGDALQEAMAEYAGT